MIFGHIRDESSPGRRKSHDAVPGQTESLLELEHVDRMECTSAGSPLE